MEVQDVANILLKWGPAGAAAVLIFIAERKLRSKWDAAKGKDRKVCAWLYAGNWVFIAVLLSVVSIYWIIDNKSANITMSGIVQDLRSPYKINDPTKELFTKTKLKNNWLYDVHWHYANAKLPQQLEIRLENKSDFHDYQIPLSDISNMLDIRVLFKEGKLWLKKSGADLVELKDIHSASGELKQLSSLNDTYKFSFVSEAVAAELNDMDLIMGALESDDSYIRQSASQYLVENIEDLNPWVEGILLSKDTSMLAKAGIITALARASSPDIREDKKWALSENAEHRIFSLVFSKDNVVAAQSRRYIIRNMSAKYLDWFDKECGLHGKGDIDLEQYCAFMGLNLYYNLAIQKWKESFNKPVDPATNDVLKAIKIINRGNGLLQHASSDKQIQFGKLIYGKAFLKHELSKLYMKAGLLDKKNVAQQEASSHFQDMLAYLNARDNAEYEYPHHLHQASCYIQNPGQNCLDNNLP